MNFVNFSGAVQKQFAKLSAGHLLSTDIDKGKIWETYIKSFPEGSNPIYITRTEHYCNCCKQFIRTVGGVVGFVDGKIETIWDINIPNEPEYQIVANALSKYVKSCEVNGKFFHDQRTVGVEKNFAQLATGDLRTHNHFYLTLPKSTLLSAKQIPSKVSDLRSSQSVFYRSLKEISLTDVDIVLDLISQDSIYRGQEHKFALTEFKKKLVESNGLDQTNLSLFAWRAVLDGVPESVLRFKNTVIGTLVSDLSDGLEIDVAVGRFESKVAPQNYKRPTALVTKKMVSEAKNKIVELGLENSLARRFATIDDVSVNDLIFVDRSAKNVGESDMFSAVETKNSKKFDKVEEISIQKFISDVVPRAKTLEVFVENRHKNNVVSLIAPKDPTSEKLFKWNNPFSWSYSGEFADAIKERVKAAGGNVFGDVRISLSWFNYDDLDLSVVEPNDNYAIYFGNRNQKSPYGGFLDVDMNACVGSSRTPVENITYNNKNTMRPGEYKVYVNQYSLREKTDVGYDVEIEVLGAKTLLTYPNQATGKKHVASILVSKNGSIEVVPKIAAESRKEKFWDIESGDFQRVTAVMKSPNCWGDQIIGNEHFFFMLDGCKNDGSARGFFNEFLREDLNAHRKVLEIVGGKNPVDFEKNQLSGLGFSSTSKNSVVVRVGGAISRVLKVMF